MRITSSTRTSRARPSASSPSSSAARTTCGTCWCGCWAARAKGSEGWVDRVQSRVPATHRHVSPELSGGVGVSSGGCMVRVPARVPRTRHHRRRHWIKFAVVREFGSSHVSPRLGTWNSHLVSVDLNYFVVRVVNFRVACRSSLVIEFASNCTQKLQGPRIHGSSSHIIKLGKCIRSDEIQLWFE